MKTTMLLDHEPVTAGRVVRLLLRLEAYAPPRTDRLPLNLSRCRTGPARCTAAS